MQDNQTRVQVGTMAPIDVVQAQAQAATARQNLAVAQSTMHTNELALKRLIVSGTADPLWNATIDPVDRPDFRPSRSTSQAAIRRALSERTDLAIAQEERRGERHHAEIPGRPDCCRKPISSATYGLVGLGGTSSFDPAPASATTNPIIGTVPGGYGDALSLALRRAAIRAGPWR